MTELHKKKTKPYYLITLGIFILLVLSWVVVTDIMSWASAREFHKQSVVDLHFHLPIKITKKDTTPQVVVKEAPLPEFTGEIDTPTKKYICDKFGVYDCKTALAIADAESHFNEQAVHINDNGTIDVGIMQINSIHFKQDGCSLQEIVFANKNVDCAFLIFKASGNKFTAWSTYTNNSYLAHL